jgi:hypothetical protein
VREGYRQTEMPRPKFIGTVHDGWTGERLLALLVLGAVLLCHGAFGASHQVHYNSGAYAPPGVGHTSHMELQVAEEAGLAGAHGEEGLGSTAYFAAFVALSLGALLWLLNSVRAWGRSRAGMLPGRLLPRPILHPARGPTPTVLQVFRR